MNPRGKTVSSPITGEELHLASAPFLFHGSLQGTGRLTFFLLLFREKNIFPLLVQLITFLEFSALRSKDFCNYLCSGSKVMQDVCIFIPS